VYSRVITGERLELGPNVITGYRNKETSSDTEINPNIIENRDDLAGPNAAYAPRKGFI